MLRRLTLNDVEELSALIARNRTYLSRWMPWAPGSTPETTREFIEAAIQQEQRDDGFQRGITDAGRLAGTVGFHRIDWRNRSTSIGYWLAEDAQGRGLMTRAVRLMLSQAFEVWDLHRVEIRAAPANERSRKIPERLGFTQEGVARGAEQLASGHFGDLVVYSLLAPEWATRRR
jgi:ribosomal-protein-serine acetyltransferase